MKTNSSKRAARPKTAPEAPFDFEPRQIGLSKLLLDPNNYRFFDRRKFKKKAATRFHEDSVQRATLESLEQSYQLDELKHSILTNGYVPMERIIVVPYPTRSGFFLVVEGNRRVAALKSILKEEKDGVLVLKAAQRASYSEIPCAVLKSSGSSLKHAERVIMGIRHIAGPRGWGAYQQALLVSELKDDEGLEFKDIGEMLGISSVEAARRYRAIGALKFMEQDELFSKKAEPAFYRLFHELVALPEVRGRFGWSTERNTFTDVDKARQFFELICSDGKEDAKLQTYGDVRKLKSVVGHPKAEDSLFNPEEPLSEAIRIGEQGRKAADASDLLDDARASLAAIGFMQARKLKPKDLAVIDELLDLLVQLKNAVSSNGNK
jgi:ParB-like chromosome segregation protein Spo0J